MALSLLEITKAERRRAEFDKQMEFIMNCEFISLEKRAELMIALQGQKIQNDLVKASWAIVNAQFSSESPSDKELAAMREIVKDETLPRWTDELQRRANERQKQNGDK